MPVLATIGLLLFSVYVVNAWGCNVHRLSIELATKLMSQTDVDMLLYFLSNSSIVQSHSISSVDPTDIVSVCLPDVIKREFRYKDTYYWHFYDIDYNVNTTQLPKDLFSLHNSNAYSAIVNEIYSFMYANEDQGDSIFFLIHILGDIMQPMHVTQLISDETPLGDKGGLKYKLQGTYKRNLHMFVDNMADFIPRKQYKNIQQLADSMHSICVQKNWYGVDSEEHDLIYKIQDWVLESHYRGREIYDILGGSHTLTDSKKEAIQTIVVHGLCRAASVISFTLQELFAEYYSLFHVNLIINYIRTFKAHSLYLDQEIEFFRNLPNSSIYSCSEFAKLRSYLETYFTKFDEKEFQSVKGYDWLVQNHEKYQPDIIDHYSKLESCYLLLDSAISRLSDILQSAEPPLDLLPVDFLCACVSMCIQLQNIPSTMIIGLKWMEDIILGRKSAHKEKIQRYCSSNCLELLRTECEQYVSVIDAMLHGPIWREYQTFQAVRTLDTSLQDFLLHKCEEELHIASMCLQHPWLTLAMNAPSNLRFAMLILLYPSLLLKDSQQSDSSLLKMLADLGTESITRGTAFNIHSEIISLVNKFTKTKELKSAISQLQKTVKNMNSSLVHKDYRETLILLVEHWIDNIKRDAGIVAPYVFVILSILSVSISELEWSCVNCIKTKRQLLVLTERVCEMATRDDDSFPVLLKDVLLLRRMLLQYVPLIEQYLTSVKDVLKKQLSIIPQLTAASSVDEDDGIRAVAYLSGKSSQIQDQVQLYCYLQLACSNLPRWILDHTDIRCVGGYYEYLRSFCKKNYYQTGQDYTYLFLFIDLAGMIEHSVSPLSGSYYNDAMEVVQDLVSRVATVQQMLWDNNQEWKAVDRDELDLYVTLLIRYRRIELKDGVIIPMDLLCDSICKQFLNRFVAVLQDKNILPETLVQFILSFHQSLLVLRSAVTQLDVPHIMEECRKGWMSESVNLLSYYNRQVQQFIDAIMSNDNSGFSLVSERFYDNGKCSSLFLQQQIQSLFILLGNSGIIELVQTLEGEMLKMLSEVTEELWDQMAYVGLIEYMIHCIYKGGATAMEELHKDLFSLFHELQGKVKADESKETEINRSLFIDSSVPFCIDDCCSHTLELVRHHNQDGALTVSALERVVENLAVWNCVQQPTGVWTGHVLEGFHGICLVLQTLGVSFESYCSKLVAVALENKKAKNYVLTVETMSQFFYQCPRLRAAIPHLCYLRSMILYKDKEIENESSESDSPDC